MSGVIPWFRLEGLWIPLPTSTIEIGGLRFEPPSGFAIQPFGLLVATGVMVGVLLAKRRAQAQGIHPEAVAGAGGYVLLSAFIFAHWVEILAYRPEVLLSDPFCMLRIWEGLSSFGGFIGSVLGLLCYARRFSVDARVVGDPIAWAFPFGWFFGRLGCFVVHDHPGRPTDFFLGVRNYEVGSPPYVTRHDLGLYEAFWALGASILFAWLVLQKRPIGFFLALLPLIYAPVRFFLDFLRATDVPGADPRYFGLTPAQYGAVALELSGVLLWRSVHRNPPSIPAFLVIPPPSESPQARA
ncbi:MAG: prolipoprotein diacylglyceryl transferase [Sandaracinaceae bacterium]|nr:prolipoprotein diacylglyceryl transferase [Sandaracinaceae bacterium]